MAASCKDGESEGVDYRYRYKLSKKHCKPEWFIRWIALSNVWTTWARCSSSHQSTSFKHMSVAFSLFFALNETWNNIKSFHLNPRTYTQSDTPTVVRGGGGWVIGHHPSVFDTLQYFACKSGGYKRNKTTATTTEDTEKQRFQNLCPLEA